MTDSVSPSIAIGPGGVIANRYRVESVLGKGRTGIVFEVSDRQLGVERVALKYLYPHLVEQQDQRERFLSEIFLVRQLSHPNVIRLYDLDFREESQPFYTMELVDGISLRELIQVMPRPFTEREVTAIVVQTLSGLGIAHENAIVHRDLKPENLLISRSGLVKIVDFGCGYSELQSNRLTQTGQMVGSPQYMAPEQFQQTTPSSATDIYALGIVAYELFCGKPPYTDHSLYALMDSHRNQTPDLDALANSGVTPQLQEFIRRALEKNPEKRFSSAHAALQFLSMAPDAASAEILAPLIEDFASSPRTDRSIRFRALLIHLLLFVLLVTQVFLFQMNEFTHRNFQQKLLNLEGYIGFDITPLRYLISMPDISLNKFETVTRAIAEEDVEAFRVWCSNYQFRNLVLTVDEDGKNLAHKISERPKLLSQVEDIGNCLPAWVYDRPDASGETPLVSALGQGSSVALMALVHAGYDPNARLSNGEAAITQAIRSGNPLLVEALVSSSSNAIRLRKDKNSPLPLRIALQQGNLSMIRSLVEIGFAVEERDELGRTALMYLNECPENRQAEVFTYLLASGARCTSRDDAGLSVLDHLDVTNNPKLQVVVSNHCASRSDS